MSGGKVKITFENISVSRDYLPTATDLVYLGVDDAEVLHPQHPRQGLGLDHTEVRVVNRQFSANISSSL